MTAGTYVSASSIPEVGQRSDRASVITNFLQISYGDPDAADPVERSNLLDPLDPRFAIAIRATTVAANPIYNGEPLSTVANQYHGTSSSHWLICTFNGYLHPDDIPIGVRLRIPDLGSFVRAFKAVATQQQRKVTV